MFVNKSTYLKLKVAYNNIHRKILGYNRWDSASCMFVNNIIVTFDALLSKNIDGFRKRVYDIENVCIFVTYLFVVPDFFNLYQIIYTYYIFLTYFLCTCILPCNWVYLPEIKVFVFIVINSKLYFIHVIIIC